MATRAERARRPSGAQRRIVAALLVLAVVAALWLGASHLRPQPPLEGRFDDAVLRGDPATVASLLDRGADPNTGSKRRQPVLMFAINSGNLAVVRLLLDRGASANARTDTSTVLTAAIAFHPEAVPLLLAHGADANLAGEDGWTPLTFAINGHRAQITRTLIARGADVNTPTAVAVGNPDAMTPLMLAAEAGDQDMVSLLLAHGADVTARDTRGETALEMARRAHRAGVIALLRRAGARKYARDGKERRL